MSFRLPQWALGLPTSLVSPVAEPWRGHGFGPRLAALAELVPPGVPAGDIGTDHALVPEALVRAGRVPRVIGSDRAREPLAAALARLAARPGAGGLTGASESSACRAAGPPGGPAGLAGFAAVGEGPKACERAILLGGRLELRHGEGLAPYAPGEIETAILAGFGARKIREALEGADLEGLGVRFLVLQPTMDLPGLRVWLAARGHRLVRETLVREGERGFISSLVEVGRSPRALAPLEALIGAIEEAHPLLPAWLEAQRDHLGRQGARARSVFETVEAWLAARGFGRP